MDFNAGKVAILQALALMKDEGELAKNISNLMDTVHEDKSRTVTLLCEALALQKKDVEKKGKIVELLDEIAKWWGLLVEDREKLLLTISNLELEKEDILKQHNNPREIYGPLLEASLKKKPRLMTNDDDDDVFKESPRKTMTSTSTAAATEQIVLN